MADIQQAGRIEEFLILLQQDPSRFTPSGREQLFQLAQEAGVVVPQEVVDSILKRPRELSAASKQRQFEAIREKFTGLAEKKPPTIFTSAVQESFSQLQEELQFGALGPDSYERITAPLRDVLQTEVPGGDFKQQAQTIIENVGKEAASIATGLVPADIAVGIAEQPFETGVSLARFFTEMPANLLVATGLNPITQAGVAMGDPESIEELRIARERVAQNPLFTVLSVLGAKGILTKGPAALKPKELKKIDTDFKALTTSVEKMRARLPREVERQIEREVEYPRSEIEYIDVPGTEEGVPVVRPSVRKAEKIEKAKLAGEAKAERTRLRNQARAIAEDHSPKAEPEFAKPEIRPGLRDKVPVALTAENIRLEDFMRQQRQEIKDLNRIKPTEIIKTMNRNIWDISANVKRALLKEGGDQGREVVMELERVAGANPKAQILYKEAEQEIFGNRFLGTGRGLTHAEENRLADYIQGRRTIELDIYRDRKNEPRLLQPGGFGAEDWADIIPKWKATEKGWPRIEEARTKYAAVMKENLDKLYEQGLITGQSYEAMVEFKNYSPREFVQHLEGPEIQFRTAAGRQISVTNSGIRALSEGSERALRNNPRLLLSQVIARTEGRLLRNEANKALYRYAEQFPESNIARIAPEGADIPAGNQGIGVMIRGKRQTIVMPNEFAREWMVRDPQVNYGVTKAARVLSGSSILRPFATGIFQPFFWVTNIPRDIALSWTATTEYSSFLPYATGQYAKDIATVFSDTVMRKGRWRDYVMEGGGMEFLTHQGRMLTRPESKIFGSVSPAFRALRDVMEFTGTTSEMLIRLALRERALKNKKSPKEATWIARRYLDFSQGGGAIKALDAGIPYLNAGIQATRSIGRAARENPATFSWKMAQIASISTGLYLANRAVNPEAWAATPERWKESSWVITTPWFIIDKNKEKRYILFTPAKDQGQRVIASIFDSLAERKVEGKFPKERVLMALNDFIPLMPEKLLHGVPMWSAIAGYRANKDFWMNEDIWRGREVEPLAEVDLNTHPFFVSTAEALGIATRGVVQISPKRLQRGAQTVFTRRNFYHDIVGGWWKATFDKELTDAQRAEMGESILQMPGIRRIVKLTPPKSMRREDVKRIERTINTRLQKQDLKMDRLVALEKTPNEVFTWIKKQPVLDQIRLFNRYRAKISTKDLPRQVLVLKNMPSAEARAVAFYELWGGLDDLGRAELFDVARRTPGFMTETFLIHYSNLVRARQAAEQEVSAQPQEQLP